MPAPTVRSWSAAPWVGESDDVIVAKPAGLAVGDLLVWFVGGYNGVCGETPPDDFLLQCEDVTGQGQMRCYTKVADAADVAASTFTVLNTESYSLWGTLFAVQDAGEVDYAESGQDSVSGYEPVAADALLLCGYTSATACDARTTNNPPDWLGASFEQDVANSEWYGGTTYATYESAADTGAIDLTEAEGCISVIAIGLAAEEEESPSYVGYGTSRGGYTVPKPVGLAEGDLMIATMFSDGNFTFYAPQGWHEFVTATGVSVGNIRMAWKYATAGEAAGGDLGFTEYNPDHYTVVAFRNAAVEGFVYKDGTTAVVTTDTGTTPAEIRGRELLLYSFKKNATSAPATSSYAIAEENPEWTELMDQNGTSARSAAIAHARRESIAPTGVWTVTNAAAGAQFVIGVMIRPTPYWGEAPYEDEGLTIIKFHQSGEFVTPAGVSKADEALIVAGGGNGCAGGGGGGGVLPLTDVALSGTMQVVVGLGAQAAASDAYKGKSSTFAGEEALGGQGGKAADQGYYIHEAGPYGSGGGGSFNNQVENVATEGQGHNGGAYGSVYNNGYPAGGGGGAGDVGEAGNNVGVAGDGGPGITWHGLEVGGGGGGGSYQTLTTPGSATHGGGAGNFEYQAKGNGTPNTGGGGGGAHNSANGGAGGSGIVAIAYKSSSSDGDAFLDGMWG